MLYPYKSSSNDSGQLLTLIKKAPYDKCRKELLVIYLHGTEQIFVAHSVPLNVNQITQLLHSSPGYVVYPHRDPVQEMHSMQAIVELQRTEPGSAVATSSE